MKPIEIHGIQELPIAAASLLPIIKEAAVIAFYGKMGVGKTTLIKELCRKLGVTDVVNSPTFSLVNEYHTESEATIYHFDFYRINKLEEVYDFGYEEYFYSGNLCLIEWPELIETLLPDNTLRLQIEQQPDGTRTISKKI
ncbi:MAG: tRNA (adenosine(37)-N6)-threonylcarbamoyltransferase complex ATPase subunit type 1 TsaE [Prevotellaceae bacterium]|jgi:tRNA threonylcarbamoyladenosine biosynthesis protein TsaE|nr:tRNA (adenosine(37)-N6)-threonylcarbamoyltransferase complex ATPase subunit type 1 TsaE [Prevotellaceae bacterium]